MSELGNNLIFKENCAKDRGIVEVLIVKQIIGDFSVGISMMVAFKKRIRSFMIDRFCKNETKCFYSKSLFMKI